MSQSIMTSVKQKKKTAKTAINLKLERVFVREEET